MLPSPKLVRFAAISNFLLLCLCRSLSVSAWSPELKPSWISRSENYRRTRIHSHSTTSLVDDTSSQSAIFQPNDSRRRFLIAAAINFSFLGVTTPVVTAADVLLPPGTKYVSGKSPIIPGDAKKKSDSTKGTRKDPDFLRSIADCRNQCQSAGSGGLAKSKEDCLSECQDVCCKTYEQCTFNIVPRI
mmetsp:Transcript_4018/g.10510  ORF Transcript_4018/g.10510 Transcript_4018/m.10510 type:complete len:187 (-) Transcript_4018:1201-1761(-)